LNNHHLSSDHESIAQKGFKDNGERARYCTKQIYTAVNNLNNLIEDLLQYAELDSMHPSITKIEIGRLVNHILAEHAPHIKKTETIVTLAFECPEIMEWQKGLVLILNNVIDNAIKYSRNSKPPRITIGSNETVDKYHIWVYDNGIGFNMKYEKRIFGLFNRLERQEDYEGTGAGLAIVKKIIDIRGGHVWAESILGEGTTFHIELLKQNESDTYLKGDDIK
jgi:light-regulated signal transduction histidine kinase (bacteriophytochrome)